MTEKNPKVTAAYPDRVVGKRDGFYLLYFYYG
jgi:hypothetical protein